MNRIITLQHTAGIPSTNNGILSLISWTQPNGITIWITSMSIILAPKPSSPWQIKCSGKAQTPHYQWRVIQLIQNTSRISNTTDMRYSSFKQVTAETIANIIRNAPSKICELNPLPISLVKEFATELAHTLTKLVSMSISTGEFSSNLK